MPAWGTHGHTKHATYSQIGIASIRADLIPEMSSLSATDSKFIAEKRHKIPSNNDNNNNNYNNNNNNNSNNNNETIANFAHDFSMETKCFCELKLYT